MSAIRRRELFTYWRVWIDWNKPIIGFCFPLSCQTPTGYSESDRNYIQVKADIVGLPRPNTPDNTFWVHVGDVRPGYRPLHFSRKEVAQALADAIGGYIDDCSIPRLE